MFDISVEVTGAVAAGKSTLLIEMEKMLRSQERYVVVRQEPIEIWDHHIKGNTTHGGLFSDYLRWPQIYGCSFQTTVLASFLFEDYWAYQEGKHQAKHYKEIVLLKESGVGSALAFMRAGMKNFTLPEYEILKGYAYDINSRITTPDLTIFLDLSYEECIKRLRKRDRLNEDKYDDRYLRQVHAEFLQQAEQIPTEKLIRVREEKDMEQVYKKIEEKLREKKLFKETLADLATVGVRSQSGDEEAEVFAEPSRMSSDRMASRANRSCVVPEPEDEGGAAGGGEEPGEPGPAPISANIESTGSAEEISTGAGCTSTEKNKTISKGESEEKIRKKTKKNKMKRKTKQAKGIVPDGAGESR